MVVAQPMAPVLQRALPAHRPGCLAGRYTLDPRRTRRWRIGTRFGSWRGIGRGGRAL